MLEILTPLIRQLEEALGQYDFSGVISIFLQGKTIFEQAHGYANRSDRIANQVNTRFGIASGTKSFTALAIGTLIQAGKLSLETRAAECIPLPVANLTKDVTVRHLLTHTSGLGDYFDEAELNQEDFYAAIPWYALKGPKDYLPLFTRPNKFPPGREFSYCNGGYILLGVIIEELSGIPYQRYVGEQIFAPCGMTDSGFFAMNALPERTAIGYVKSAEGLQTNIFNLPIIGASDGGAFSTVHDLKKFWTAILTGQVLKQDLLEQFLRPAQQITSEGNHIHYGYGFWSCAPPGQEPLLYMEGCDAGVSFQSNILRSQELILTVVSNTMEGIWPLTKIIQPYIIEIILTIVSPLVTFPVCK